MVAKGYACVSVKLETEYKLRSLAKSENLKSIAKAIEYLLEKEGY